MIDIQIHKIHHRLAQRKKALADGNGHIANGIATAHYDSDVLYLLKKHSDTLIAYEEQAEFIKKHTPDIVRCAECVSWETNACPLGGLADGDDFCSYGRRKEAEK